MLKPDEEQSFFDRERDRLTGEIATVRAFLMPSSPGPRVDRFIVSSCLPQTSFLSSLFLRD